MPLKSEGFAASSFVRTVDKKMGLPRIDSSSGGVCSGTSESDVVNLKTSTADSGVNCAFGNLAFTSSSDIPSRSPLSVGACAKPKLHTPKPLALVLPLPACGFCAVPEPMKTTKTERKGQELQMFFCET